MKKNKKTVALFVGFLFLAVGLAVMSSVAQAHVVPANPDGQVTVIVNVDNTQGGSATPSTFTVLATSDDASSTPSPSSG